MSKVTEGNKFVLVKCKVSLGMFSTERAVTIELTGGQRATAFAHRREVVTSKKPAKHELLRGCLRAELVEIQGNSALIELPQPALGMGTRVRVPTSIIQRR